MKQCGFTKNEIELLTVLLDTHIDNYGFDCNTKDYNKEVKFVNKIYEKPTGEKDAFALETD